MDDDEVEFLDTVLESTRAREEAVRKETAEELEHFRKQQEKVEKAADDEGSPEAEEEQWAARGKKRKKSHAKESLIGIKLRKTSSATEFKEAKSEMNAAERKQQVPKAGNAVKVETIATTSKLSEGSAEEESPKASPSPSAAGLGLVAYSSDEDD